MNKYLSRIKQYLFLALVSLPTLSQASGTLENPLIFDNDNGSNGIAALISAIVGMIQIIAVPIIVFFLIYSGFLYVTARGNPETTKKASRALMYAIIGAVVVLGAQAISVIVQNTVNEF